MSDLTILDPASLDLISLMSYPKRLDPTSVASDQDISNVGSNQARSDVNDALLYRIQRRYHNITDVDPVILDPTSSDPISYDR